MENREERSGYAQKIAVMESQLANMSEDVAHIRTTVDSLVNTLSKLHVMEAVSNSQERSIKRAFNEISELKKENSDLDHARQVERDRVSKWIYGFGGAGLAVCIVWSVLGFHLTDSIRSAVKASEEVRAYMLAEKFKRERE